LCEAIERPDLVDAQLSEDTSAHRSMEEVFRSRTRHEWEEILSAIDACCEPVLDLDEVAKHPQVIARGLFHRTGRAPRLGEHTEEVLREVGL
jgi:alpha-methylacyl-CoA racemase